MSSKTKVTVLGAGNMGTAIAQVIGNNGYSVKIWNHEGDPDPLLQITESRENRKYAPGLMLSENVIAEPLLEKAVTGSHIIFFVVPSHFMDGLVKRAAAFIKGNEVCVDASKGIDEKSLLLIPDILRNNLPKLARPFVVSISGPAIANDMATGNFTAMNICGKNIKAVSLVKKVMENNTLKLISTSDVIGIEVAGSFKNVYAIAMGVCDGLNMPMNTKAALLVVALNEIGILVKEMGGKKETVYDLAGLGDLVGTGLCATSRNRCFGECLAKGFSVDEALRNVGQVVEGRQASKVLRELGRKYAVKLPFAEMIYRIVWKQEDVKQCFVRFLQKIK